MNFLNFKFEKEKKYIFLYSIIFMVLLDFVYQLFISPIFNGNVKSFGYYGYPLGSFNLLKFYYASIMLFLVNFLLPIKIQKPSDMIIMFYYFFSTIPFFSLYTLNLIDSNIFFIELVSVFIFYLLTFPAYFFYNSISLKHIIIKNLSFMSKIIIFITIGVSIILFFKFVLHTRVNSLLNVYVQRAIFNNSGFVINYIVSFLSFGVLSFLFFIYIIKRKIKYIGFILLLAFIIFLSTGSKLIFGSVFLILLLIKYYKGYFYSYKIGFYLILVIVVSIIFYSFFNKDILLSLLVRRTFILPAQIFNLYFSYFTFHEYNLFSAYTHTFIDTFYKASVSHVIGSTYFLPNTHANSGIISDAYANFGILGVIIFSIILCLILIILNFLNSRFGNTLTPLFAGVAVSLTNSGLLGVFIYQIFPIIFIFLTLYFFQRKRKLK